MDEIVEEVVQMGSSNSLRETRQIPVMALPSMDNSVASFYVAPVNTRELSQDEEPGTSTLMLDSPPTGGVPLGDGDEELEFVRDGQTLRVRLGYDIGLSVSEYHAHQLLMADEPFAMTVRPCIGHQIYLPSVVNTRPYIGLFSTAWTGWLELEILH